MLQKQDDLKGAMHVVGKSLRTNDNRIQGLAFFNTSTSTGIRRSGT